MLLDLAAAPLVTSCAALVLQQECSPILPLLLHVTLLVHVGVLLHDSSAVLLLLLLLVTFAPHDSSPVLLLLLHHSTSTASGAGLYVYLSTTSSLTSPTTFTSGITIGITSGTRAAVYLCGKTARQWAPLLHSTQSASLLCTYEL